MAAAPRAHSRTGAAADPECSAAEGVGVAVPTMDELATLIGRPVEEPAVQSFLAEHGPARQRLTDRYARERTFADPAAGYEITYHKGRRGQPDRVVTVFLYVEPRDGYAAFAGRLSGGLAPADGPAEVAAKLGPATRQGASDPAGEWVWERRDTDRLCLHVAYRQGGVGIRLITLMAPDVAP